MKVIDTYNAIVGAAVAVLSYIFGEHWILFALFLAFNVADWITGWMKSRLAHKENSKAGWKGVLKKLAYWIMIAVAFGASAVFVEIGKTLGVDLGITTLLGFFVLASLLVNEIRSICEFQHEIFYLCRTRELWRWHHLICRWHQQGWCERIQVQQGTGALCV